MASVTLVLLLRHHPPIPLPLRGEQELRGSDKADGRGQSTGERLLDHASMQPYLHLQKEGNTVTVLGDEWKTVANTSS